MKKMNSNRPPVGTVLEIKIDEIDELWRGCGDLKDGYVAVISGLIPGDAATAEISSVSNHSNLVYCNILDITTKSSDRIDSFCNIYPGCYGCPGAVISYDAQVKYKEGYLKSLFPVVEKFHKSPDIYGYRSKTKLIAGKNPWGTTILGGYKHKSHEIIELKQCKVIAPELNLAISELRKIVADIPPYDEKSGEGLLRSIFLKSNSSGEILLTFVLKTEPDKLLENNLKEIRIPGVVGVTININSTKGNRLTGSREYLLWGKPYLIEDDHPVPYFINATDFSQTNQKIAKKIYETIIEWVPDNAKRIIDLFSGNGPIALALIDDFREIVAVEKEARACDLARTASSKLRVIQEDVNDSDFLRTFFNTTLPDLVIVNPPRSGLRASLIERLGESELSDILYMSCSPKSLFRDSKLLESYGYKLHKIEGFDMFPHTPHFETLAYFKRI